MEQDKAVKQRVRKDPVLQPSCQHSRNAALQCEQQFCYLSLTRITLFSQPRELNCFWSGDMMVCKSLSLLVLPVLASEFRSP